MSFPADGVCDFACDPEKSADQQAQFWIPRLQPHAVKLAPVRSPVDGDAAGSMHLTRLPGLDLRQAEDGWHALWCNHGVRHQFWLSEVMPDTAVAYDVTLALDRFFELRAHAARRLWRSFGGKRPGREFRKMPAQLRQLHILRLRAVDARQRGESHRTIAEVLLGFRGTRQDWLDDPCRSKSRRLVAEGFAMMHGGYRALLHYPIKAKSR